MEARAPNLLKPESSRFAVDIENMVLDRPHTFRVRTDAYTDPQVFELEMKRIFERTWVFVAHDSEIPNVGDFKTSYIGLQPVIVVRSAPGEINVLVNRCMHRGAILCRESRGNARAFDCPYHGWVYSIDGSLAAVPHREELGGYSAAFRQPEGLYRVPRVDMYRGFIFASFNPQVPPLVQHLGRAKVLLDRRLNMSPVGEIVFRSDPFVGRYRGNWKFQAENIVDDYHFLFVHNAFVQLQTKYGDTTGNFGLHPGGNTSGMKKVRYRGNAWGCAQGHGILDAPHINLEAALNGPFADYYRALKEKHGEDELAWIAGRGIGCIFPNLGTIHQQMRVWRPIAPDLTEVTIYPYELEGAPGEFNQGMLHAQERFYGPAGHGAADDMEMFAVNHAGLAGRAVEWLILERGVDTDEVTEGGDYQGKPSSEACQRAFWRQWKRLMSEA